MPDKHSCMHSSIIDRQKNSCVLNYGRSLMDQTETLTAGEGSIAHPLRDRDKVLEVKSR
jgi:hypothetical protein